jgi:hypothetical protein
MCLFCVAVVAASLAGCGAIQTMNMGSSGSPRKPPPNTHKCTLNDDCVVTVKVVVREATCDISIKPDVDLEMDSGGLSGSVSHLIRWVLDDDSQDLKFRFAEEPYGVILKDSTPDPSQQFFKKARTNGGREYQWRDRNGDFNYYDYSINIIQKDSGRKCTKDPRIWNN